MFRLLISLLGATIFVLVSFAEISLRKDTLYKELDGGKLSFQSANISLLREIDNHKKNGRRRIYLNDDWGYVLHKEDGSPLLIPISRYFVSDFASVPRPLDAFFNPFGRHAEAAIIHDWLYAVGARKGQNFYDERRRADVIFFHAMRQQGTDPLSARLMYSAVRIFGFLQSWQPKYFGEPSFGRASEWEFFDPLSHSVRQGRCSISKPENPYASAKSLSTTDDSHKSLAFRALQSRNTRSGGPDVFKLNYTERAIANNYVEAIKTIDSVFQYYGVDYTDPAQWTEDDYARFGRNFYAHRWWKIVRRPICQLETLQALLRSEDAESRASAILAEIHDAMITQYGDGVAIDGLDLATIPALAQARLANDRGVFVGVPKEIMSIASLLELSQALELPGEDAAILEFAGRLFSNFGEIAYFEWLVEKGIDDPQIKVAIDDFYSAKPRNPENNAAVDDKYNKKPGTSIIEFLSSL